MTTLFLLKCWCSPQLLLLPSHSTTVCTILLGERPVAPTRSLWMWCWLLHLGDFSEQNSLELACSMGERALFLHELSTATAEKDQDKIALEYRKDAQSKQQLATGTDQFKNVSELGRDQLEDFLVKNILLSHLISSHLISSHLMSSHLISSHLTSCQSRFPSASPALPSDGNMHTQCVMADSLWSVGIMTSNST